MIGVKVLPSAYAVARAVAEQFVTRLAAIQAEGRVPSVVLTGGTIANEIYRAVAGLPSRDVDWTQVDFWWGDERYVPADSTDRNDRAAELDLLDIVAVDPAHPVAGPARRCPGPAPGEGHGRFGDRRADQPERRAAGGLAQRPA